MTTSYKYQTRHVSKASVHECNANDKESLLASLRKNNPEKTIASDVFDPEKDLLKIVAVMVSTGENRNDDVFLPSELVRARKSGADKLLNIEHDVDNIVGHMTRSFITDKDGNEISDVELEKNGTPQDFDIMNEAVVYAYAKPEVADVVRKLAAADKLFVSVEMWFQDYDFLVGSKIIKRNQTTAHLDNCLRVNGGDGSYKEAHVGRVLRDVLIGGEGIVENPANLDSVANTVAELASASVRDVEVYREKAIAENIIEDLSHKSSSNQQDTEEEPMKELLKEMLETVKVSATVAAKEAVDEALKNSDDSSPENTPETTSATVTAVAAEDDKDKPNVDNERVSKLQASVDKLTKRLETQSEVIDQLTMKNVVASRREQLRTIGFTNEQVEMRIGRIADMTEAEFKEQAADYVQLFNELNLQPANASDKDEDKNENQTDDTDDTDDKDSTDASDNQEDDDVIINMDELKNVDGDLDDQGGSATASTDDLVAKFYGAVAKQLGHNKHWQRAVNKDDEGDK